MEKLDLERSCLPERFSEAAKAQSAAIFYDASHAFGCEIQKKTIGGGERIEIFSLHETEILSGGEGGFITTNDDDLAEMLRNIRPSYLAPVRKIFEGTKTANARMSEAQAAITLLNLENIQKYRKTNELLFQSYQRLLRTISGVQIVEPAGITLSNYSRLICLIDEKQFGVNRDMLLQILRAENVEVLVPVYYPLPVNSKTMLPNTQRIAMNAVQLPLGSKVTPDHIESICEIIERIHENSIAICSKLEAS
jgi:dTDP-4-amino-4,6-dideoxygalactose transaminase